MRVLDRSGPTPYLQRCPDDWPALTTSQALTPRRWRDAGAYSATAGRCCHRPRRPSLASAGTLRSSGPHGPGLPSGTRARRFCTRAALWLSAALRRRSPALGLEPLEAVGGFTPLLTLHRKRSSGRPGSDLAPPGGLLPGAGRCHVGCWIQTPRQSSDGPSIATARKSGDFPDHG